MGRGHWQQNQTRFQIWSWSWWYQVSSKRNSTQTRLWALSICSLLVWPFTKYFNKTNRVSIFHVIIDSVCSDLTGVYVIEFGLISFKFIHTKNLEAVAWPWLSRAGNQAPAIRTRCALLRFHKLFYLVLNTDTLFKELYIQQLPDRLHINLITFTTSLSGVMQLTSITV